MSCIIFSDELQVYIKAWDIFSSINKTCQVEKRLMFIGLSGGSMPLMLEKSYSNKLSTDSNFKIDWNIVHVFFCDERCVPLNDNDSTYNAYMNSLFPKTGISENNIHKISYDPNISSAEIAAKYQSELFSWFIESHIPRLDLLLLGTGIDGHTCSLFPNHVLLFEENLMIAHIDDSPKPPSKRVTMTLPLLCNAYNIVFIATGEGKAEKISKVVKEKITGVEFPCSLVKPISGEIYWLLDKQAAKLL